jgi:hypothetical protein
MSVPGILTALGPLLAAAILGTDRRIVRRLRRARATEPARAVAFGDPNALVVWRLRRLLGAGALAMPVSGSYFIVEPGWRAYRARRRRRGLTMLAICGAAFLVYWMLTLFRNPGGV